MLVRPGGEDAELAGGVDIAGKIKVEETVGGEEVEYE